MINPGGSQAGLFNVTRWWLRAAQWERSAVRPQEVGVAPAELRAELRPVVYRGLRLAGKGDILS